MGKCADNLLEEFGFLDRETAEAIENDIAKLRDTFSERREFNKAVKEYVEKAEHDLKWHSARVIRDKLKEQRVITEIIGEGDFKKGAKRLIDYIDGDNSVDTLYRATLTKYTKQFRGALKEEGIEEVWMSGSMDRLVHEQMFNKANGLADVNNPQAVRLAELTKKMNDQIYEDMRLAGLDVKYRKDFLVSRNYDDIKLRDAGFQGFRDSLLGTEGKEGLLDIAKTFSPEIIKQGKHVDVLEKMFDDILDTRRIYNAGDQDMIGTKSYLRNLRGRKLEFASGEAEYEFSQLFGRGGSLAESFELQMDKSAKTYANVQRFGTRPDKTFKALKDKFEQVHLKQGGDKGELHRTINKADAAFINVVAPPHRPTTKLDRGINALRGLTAFSKLGSSFFAAAYDINATGLQYALRTGLNQAEGYTKAFLKFAEIAQMDKTQRAQLADMLNTQIWFNDMAVVMGAGKGDFDTGFDRVNRFFTKAYKFTGVPWQTEISRLVNASLQSEAMFKMVHATKMNDLQLKAMQTYKFTDAEFNLLRNVKHGNEPKILSTQHVMDIPLEKFDANPALARKMQAELHDKVATYIDDAVQKGTPTPTARTKRQLMKGREQDPNIRAVANLVMQFKETAWKIATDNMDAFRTFSEAGGKGRAAQETFMYMTMGLMSYAMIESARRALFNQESIVDQMQSNDKNAIRNLVFDYINKSSMIPVLSDAADAATSPYYGDNFIRYAAGPNFGMAQDLFNVVKSPSKKGAGKFAKRHLLPMNHFGIKAAQRHFFEYDWLTGQKIRK